MKKGTYIAHAELQRINLNSNILNMENTTRVLARARQMHMDSHTLSTQENIRQSAILILDRASLTVDVKGDVAHVGLDLREGELEVVRVAVGDGVVGRELHVVVRVEGDYVGEDVCSFHGQVLDHEVHLVVGVFDAGDGLASGSEAGNTSESANAQRNSGKG